jgi:SAM-dependent methyltransferase
MSETSVGHFYDELADDYHLIYPDWDASIRRQGDALDALIGQDRGAVLDCSCGIGTQAIGLAQRGHRVTGTDLSPRAAARAAREAARRNLSLPTAAADMRRLPFPDGRFDTVVCADNSLPHLLTEQDVHAALTEMRRVLRPAGLLLVSTRPYDDFMGERPVSTPPRVHRSADRTGGGERTVTFQLWHWYEDGEHYDLEHFQLLPADGEWRVRVRRTTYWALRSDRLARLAAEAGFAEPRWRMPRETGFFQPLLVARAGDQAGCAQKCARRQRADGQTLFPGASSVPSGPERGDESDEQGGHADLQDVADPVDAAGVPYAEGGGERVAGDGPEDAEDGRQPQRDGLAPGDDQLGQQADDESRDDGPEKRHDSPPCDDA